MAQMRASSYEGGKGGLFWCWWSVQTVVRLERIIPVLSRPIVLKMIHYEIQINC